MAARRRKKSSRRYGGGMSEEEWRDWGEKFGERMAKRGEDFGEEMADLGERFGRRMQRRGREWGRHGRNWWYMHFGFAGPLIASVVGIILLVVAIVILKIVNFVLGSSFITAIAGFLYANIYLFFGIFLFTNYNEYFSKHFRSAYWMITPVTAGISLVIAFWIIASMLTLINVVPHLAILTTIANFINANLLTIFVIVLVLGYVFVIIGRMFMPSFRD
jgi:hypothetical protein